MATDYLELNRDVLEALKESDPIKYRSLKRYLECQNIYAETGDWDQAAAHWNAWAKKLLAERKKLEVNGEWQAKKDFLFGSIGKNRLTLSWLNSSFVNFSNMSFYAEVNKGKIGDNINSDYNVFVGELSFRDFIFPSDVSFWNAKLRGNAIFTDAVINGDANFTEASFSRNAWFLGMMFYGRVGFKNARFKYDANFGDAKFRGNSKFSGATFSGDACFKGATFSCDVWFSEATFNSDAWFGETIFSGKVYFREVTFSNFTRFEQATFSKSARFTEVMFNGDAWFKQAMFKAETNFEEATFRGDTYFQGTTFGGNTIFRLAQFERPVHFLFARFRKKADFSSIRSEKGFSLHGAWFRVVPDFNEAVFHAPPVLDAMHVGEQLTAKRVRWLFRFRHVPEPEQNAKRISRNFRALGKMAYEARDWLNEMEFFAQEIRARRFGEDFPIGKNMGRFWFGLIYEKASNFGRSFARPLGWWAFVTALFTLIYAALASEWGAWNGWDALYLSVRHGLVVGGLVRTGHMQQVIEAMFGEMGSGLGLLMMGQTVLSAFFLFLFSSPCATIFEFGRE